MNQARFLQGGVSLTPPSHKLVLRGPVFEVFVLFPLLADRHGRDGTTSPSLGRVVMSSPYLDMRSVAEQFLHRVIQLCRIAAGEVTARGTDVGVEKGVAAKDVVFYSRVSSRERLETELRPALNLVSNVVWRVAREVQHSRIHVANLELPIIFK